MKVQIPSWPFTVNKGGSVIISQETIAGQHENKRGFPLNLASLNVTFMSLLDVGKLLLEITGIRVESVLAAFQPS